MRFPYEAEESSLRRDETVVCTHSSHHLLERLRLVQIGNAPAVSFPFGVGRALGFAFPFNAFHSQLKTVLLVEVSGAQCCMNNLIRLDCTMKLGQSQ